MNRYLSSLLLTSIIYVIIMGLVFYFLNKDDISHSEVRVIDVYKVNFSILKPQKIQEVQPKPEKKVEPKPKKKPKPKPEKKPKQKKKIKPKPEPKPVEEPIIEEPIEEPIIEAQEELIEEIEEDVVTELVEETIEEETITQEQIAQQEELQKQIQEANAANILKQKQDIFIANLVERINSNKSYPNMARRRAIEGSVEVTFKILSDGDVRDIEIVTGRRVFKKSALQAIERSFPVEIESTLFDFPKEFKITIVYILR